jgi:hypothetical protein
MSEWFGRQWGKIKCVRKPLELLKRNPEAGQSGNQILQCREYIVCKLVGRLERIEDCDVGRNANRSGGIILVAKALDQAFRLRDEDDEG